LIANLKRGNTTGLIHTKNWSILNIDFAASRRTTVNVSIIGIQSIAWQIVVFVSQGNDLGDSSSRNI
jgi:hypothetical protein